MTSPEILRERARGHLPLKPNAFHVLLSLAAEESHGYAIMKAVEARSEGEVVLQPGALYRELKRLLDAGLISELDERPVADRESDQRRRYYAISEIGRYVLAAEAARMSRLVERADALTRLREGGSSG